MDAKHLIRIISDENLTEIMVRGNGMYLRAFERDDESVDYTLFDADLSEIDGGVCDADSLEEAFLYITSDCLCGQDLQIISEDLTDEILEMECKDWQVDKSRTSYGGKCRKVSGIET